MIVPETGSRKITQPIVPWARPPQLGASAQGPGGNLIGHGAVVEDTSQTGQVSGIPGLPPAYGGTYTPPTGPNATDIEQARGDWWLAHAQETAASEKSSDSGKGSDTKYDPYADPFVANLVGQKNTRMAGVRGQALEKQKNLLLGFGSKEIARSILGAKINPATGAAYSQEGWFDPWLGTINENEQTGTGWLETSGWKYHRNVRDFNEGENAANLWYGGGRVGGLADMARQRTVDIAEQTQALRENLQAAEDPVITAELNWQDMIDAAAREAYNRKIAGTTSS